jgi:dipeptidase E
MKYYLSSFKLGDTPTTFVDMLSGNKAVAYIPNAKDFTGSEPARLKAHIDDDVAELEALGLKVEVLDLKDYFGRPSSELQEHMNTFSGVWVSGGDVYVLRQAMRLSGFDQIMIAKSGEDDFVYGGYSAGCCVLSPSLKPYQVASNPNDFPYPNQTEAIWDGLGLIDFAFMPHFESHHLESDQINDEVEYSISNNIAYRTVSDGQVIDL